MKNNFKKSLYSICALTLTMAMIFCCVLGSVSVFATDGHTLVSHGCNSSTSAVYNVLGATNVTVEHPTGVFGKGAGDKSVKLSTGNAAATPRIEGTITEANYPIKTDTDALAVFSFNVYPVKALSKIEFGTNQNKPIGATVQQNVLVTGQWNRIVYVYDRTASDYGTTTLYVNGRKISEYPLVEGTFDALMAAGATYVPWRGIFNLSANAEIYVDDIVAWRVPKSTATPYVGVPLLSDELLLGNGVISGTTVAQMNGAVSGGPGNTVTVKAYRGGDMTMEIGQDEAVQTGDIILLEELIHKTDGAAPDKIRTAYNYYQVADDKMLLYDLEEQTNFNKVRCTVAKDIDGFYGKPAEEKVMRVTYNAAADTNNRKDSYLDSTFSDVAAYQASGRHPIVFECDFLPESHVEYVEFTTGQSPLNTMLYPGDNAAHPESKSTSEHDKTPGFLHGRWNKLRMVVDYENKTATTYLNGVKIGNTINPSDLYKTQTRFIIKWDSDEGTDSKTCCVDNFRIYEWIDPQFENDAIVLNSVADSYLKQGDTISFFGGKITDAVKTEMGVSDVWAFDGESGYSPIAEGTDLSDDNLVVLRNAAGSYGYYKVCKHLLAAGGAGYIDDTQYTDGGLKFTATGSGDMLLAQYNSAGNLLNVSINHLADVNNSLTLNQVEGCASIQAMLWSDLVSAAPHAKSIKMRYNPNYEKKISLF